MSKESTTPTWGAFDERGFEAEQLLDLGSGVSSAGLIMKGRVAGSGGRIQLRYAAVEVWAEGLIVRATIYPDIDGAGATAERLVEERE